MGQIHPIIIWFTDTRPVSEQLQLHQPVEDDIKGQMIPRSNNNTRILVERELPSSGQVNGRKKRLDENGAQIQTI